MEAIEIENLVESLYIDDSSSRPVKIRTNDGNVVNGVFIKALQFRNKTRFNLWNMSCLKDIDLMLKGEDILSIEPTTLES